MRGKRCHFLSEQFQYRLIPAHAGKTSRRFARSVITWAHPRACGENILAVISSPSGVGSSPRMRGKRAKRLMAGMPTGLIPAHAGKTVLPLGAKLLARAHPRACGENHADIFKGVCEIGSSPRMRGKLTGITAPRLRCRLIPAHAGKTSGRSILTPVAWAHPRACGENPWYACNRIHDRGSSPRMRGKPGGVCRRRGLRGLIPAHAGKTAL